MLFCQCDTSTGGLLNGTVASDGIPVSRVIDDVSSSGIVFRDGYQNKAVDNKAAVPWYIFGIKCIKRVST